jgi:hypothetical protein
MRNKLRLNFFIPIVYNKGGIGGVKDDEKKTGTTCTRGNIMMHQRVDPYITLDDRPDRDTVIEKDEILSLIIDVETMSTVDFYNKYFSLEERP